MKNLMSGVGIFAVAVFILSGCGNKNDKNKNPSNDPISHNVAGSMGGQTWSFSSGVAMPTASGYEVYLAGNGETLSCESSNARTNHLAFRIPNQLGSYNWDRANPGSGSSPLFFVYKFQTEHGYGSETVISQTSTINVIGLSNDTLSGSVKGTSSGSGTRAGSVDGNFVVKICGASASPEVPLYRRIDRLQGLWLGSGYIKNLFTGRIENTQIGFEIILRGSDQAQFRVTDRNTSRTLFDSTLLIRNDYIEQMCIPDGSSVPQVERVGSYNRNDGSISMQILNSNCSLTQTKLRFAHQQDGLSLMGNYEKVDFDRNRNRSAIEFASSLLTRF